MDKLDQWLNRKSDWPNQIGDNKKKHIDYLFYQLVNYCIIHNVIDGNGDYLINKNMKKEFYKFCFKFS